MQAGGNLLEIGDGRSEVGSQRAKGMFDVRGAMFDVERNSHERGRVIIDSATESGRFAVAVLARRGGFSVQDVAR